MKKTVISMILGLVIVGNIGITHAQVADTTDTQSTYQSLLQTVIALLVQEVQQLEQQLATVEANQGQIGTAASTTNPSATMNQLASTTQSFVALAPQTTNNSNSLGMGSPDLATIPTPPTNPCASYHQPQFSSWWTSPINGAYGLYSSSTPTLNYYVIPLYGTTCTNENGTEVVIENTSTVIGGFGLTTDPNENSTTTSATWLTVNLQAMDSIYNLNLMAMLNATTSNNISYSTSTPAFTVSVNPQYPDAPTFQLPVSDSVWETQRDGQNGIQEWIENGCPQAKPIPGCTIPTNINPPYRFPLGGMYIGQDLGYSHLYGNFYME